MKTWMTCLILALAIHAGATIPAHAVTIDWVTVGDPGNAADTTGYGAVADAYRIGKYEVTIQQYTDFLNAVAASDPYSLYNANMATDLNIAGISRSGTSGGYTYSVIGPSGTTPPGASSPGNRPIPYVSWFDAARFANWMQNGQGSSSTETGAYTLGGATSGTAPAVNPGAQFYIPTENQWYKAAYYKGSGTNAGYWTYATQSDTAPGNVIGNGANQANYKAPDGQGGTAWAVTQFAGASSTQNYLTDTGAFLSSPSYYGTFDQTGSLLEWCGSNSTTFDGNWTSTVTNLGRNNISSPFSLESWDVGFRLASPVAVPEPSTYATALAGLACGCYSMFRRRRAR